MSQLNKTAKNVIPKSLSNEGNLQKDKSHTQMLYEIVTMTLLGKDDFYNSSNQLVELMDKHLKALVRAGLVDYVANLAVHARVNMYIRSMPIVLVVHLAKFLREDGSHYDNMRGLVRDVIQRADEMTDMYAYALQVFGNKRKVPMAIKNGIADATLKFDEYQFGKYKAAGKTLTLKQLFQIVHPKGKTVEQLDLFKKVNDESLTTPYTWETELSKGGRSKTEIWEDLIDSNKLGIMAQIRNLRNMAQAPVSNKHMAKICANLDNRDVIKRSKQMPYRFISALEATKELHNPQINRAISRAVDHSLDNVPDLGDNVWIIVDCSLSMGGNNWSVKSATDSPFAKASLFAAALAKKNGDSHNFRLTMFSDRAGHVGYNPDSPILDIIEKMKDEMYGGGTNLNAALDLRHDMGFVPTTIVLFSDMEVRRLNRFSGGYGADNQKFLARQDILKIAINANPSNNTPAHESDGWLQVSGYSDSIFNYIKTRNAGTSITGKLSKPFMGVEAVKAL